MNKINDILINLNFLGQLGKGGPRFAQGLLTACEELDDFKQMPVAYLLNKRHGCDWLNFPERTYRYVSEIFSVDHGIMGGLARYLIPVRGSSPQTVVFTPSYQTYVFSKNHIVTVHDVIPLNFPRNNRRQYFAFKYFLPIILKRALHIVTVSQTTKEAIKKYYGIDDSKISVISNAADRNTFKPDPNTAKTNSLLTIGAFYPNKNIHELLEMHHLWQNKYTVDVISPESPYRSRLERFCLEAGIQSRVNFLSGVDEQMLIYKYRRARALIYPSWDEGFGLPLIEAMSTGTPVVASDIPVHREVCGDAAIYVTLGDKASWERAFAILDNDQMVSIYLNKGLERSKYFSWSRSATQLTNLLKKFIN